MNRILLMVFSLLVPLAFSGGYMLATDNAWKACLLQVPRGRHGVPAVCGDISMTGIATGLGVGITGVVVWAIAWAIAWFILKHRAAS